MKLYELTEQHKELQVIADETDEDLMLALTDTFEALEGEFNDKAVSLISVTRNMDSDIEALDNEVKRLQARKKGIENKKEWMKEYLRTNMENSGISKIECPLFSISLAKGRDVVQIENEGDIPADYLNIKTTMTPDKKRILDDLKKGVEVDGCKLGTSKSSLRIK